MTCPNPEDKRAAMPLWNGRLSPSDFKRIDDDDAGIVVHDEQAAKLAAEALERYCKCALERFEVLHPRWRGAMDKRVSECDAVIGVKTMAIRNLLWLKSLTPMEVRCLPAALYHKRQLRLERNLDGIGLAENLCWAKPMHTWQVTLAEAAEQRHLDAPKCSQEAGGAAHPAKGQS